MILILVSIDDDDVIAIIGVYLIGVILFSFGLTRFMSFSNLLGIEESRSIYWI